MIRFPLRLLAAAYGGALFLGLASWLTGGTLLGAALVFWLGGTLGLFVLPLVGGFRREAEAEEAPSAAERIAAETARWAADLAAERHEAEVRREDAAAAAAAPERRRA